MQDTYDIDELIQILKEVQEKDNRTLNIVKAIYSLATELDGLADWVSRIEDRIK